MKVIVYSDTVLKLAYKDPNILECQAYELVKYLPNWIVYEPFPNGGRAPAGSYTTLYSPIFENKINKKDELIKIFEGLSQFMKKLNANGQSVARIECRIEQSNDLDAVPHPVNNIKGHNGTNQKYDDNGDCKFCDWVFDDITKQDMNGNIYGNIVNRSSKKFKIKKKYWVFIIDSSWNSI